MKQPEKRMVIEYPNKENPHVRGKVYIDPESDEEVIYYHYENFWKPGMGDPINHVLEVDKATGRTRLVQDPPS